LIVVAERSIFCLVKDQRHIKFSFWFFEQDLQSRGIQEEVLEFWIGSIQSQDKIDLNYFVSRRVQHSHGSIPIEPSQKKKATAPVCVCLRTEEVYPRAITHARRCSHISANLGKFRKECTREN
jgi:hypothetical protein